MPNVNGKPDDDTLCGILATAIQRGVHTLDTAAGYGERNSGSRPRGAGFDIVTKLPNMSIFLDDVGKPVTEAIEAACARLNVQRLHGLLLHRADNLVSAAGPAIWAAMSRAQADGRVTKIGYSVYDPTELDRLVPDYPPGLVQLPFNGFDQRFAVSGWTRRLREAGCEVHARSIFLQGYYYKTPYRAPPILTIGATPSIVSMAPCALLVARQGSLLSHWPSRTVTSTGWCVASTVRASFHNYATGLTVQPRFLHCRISSSPMRG